MADPAFLSGGRGVTGSRRSAQQGFTSLKRSAEYGFTPLKRSAQQGFTLLEMLVALAVFSLAALALIRLQAVTVRTAADLDDRQMARIVARNLMVDLQTSPDALAIGDRDGTVENGGQAWHWRQKVSKTDDDALVRVDIHVESGRTGTSPAVLTFLKAQP